MTKGDLIVAMALEDKPIEGYPVLTEEHPFFQRLVCFMATKEHWLGTATDLLKELNDRSTPSNTVTKLLKNFGTHCITVMVLMYVSDALTVKESLKFLRISDS